MYSVGQKENSRIKYDIREVTKMKKEILQKLQQVELDILKQIHEFCVEYGIKYSLYAGTALGAVRHHGFIPWDDDVDIVMTRDEYTKFVKQWNKVHITGYFMENAETDEECPINHTKIRKEGTVLLSSGEDENQGHHGIWVDIFVFDKVKEGFWGEKVIYYNGIKRVLMTRGNRRNSLDSLSKKFLKRTLSLIPKKIQRKQLQKANKRIQKYNCLTNDFVWVDPSAVQYIKIQFPKELTEQYSEIEFENEKFMIFKDYTTLLRIEYGDYMKLPPEKERVCKHNPVKIQFNER